MGVIYTALQRYLKQQGLAEGNFQLAFVFALCLSELVTEFEEDFIIFSNGNLCWRNG